MSENQDTARPPGDRRLYLIGILTASVYFLTGLVHLKDPQLPKRTAKEELFAWFVCLSLLFLFWKGYRLVKNSSEQSPRTIVYFAIIFCFLAFLILPFHSTDIFGYINLGWQQVHYGQNAYLYALADVPNWQMDPMFRRHWIYIPDTYGFLFTLLTRVLCRIGNGHMGLTVFLFKAVNLLAYAITAWLVWLGSTRLGRLNPVTSLYLFMWNPLIVMHHLANGHNDLLAACFVMLALYLAIIGNGFWIIPALVVGALFKHAPAVVIPLAFIFVFKRHGWKTATTSCLVAFVIVALAGAPFLPEWRSFRITDIVINMTLIDNSFHSFLIHIFEVFARLVPALSSYHDAANSLIKNTLRLGLLVFLVVQLVKIPRNFSRKIFLEQSLLSMFVLICIVSSKFNAWYMGMLLPMALLLDEQYWLRRLVILVTSFELLSLTFFKQAYILNYFTWVVLPALIVFFRWRRKPREMLQNREP